MHSNQFLRQAFRHLITSLDINKRFTHLLFLKHRIKLKYQLRHVLRKSYNTHSHDVKYRKKVLIPLIETSHYQSIHVLLIAKALQLRGADVKVLLCGSFLPGCEIKSKRNIDKDVCRKCRFNATYVVPEFGLNVIKLEDVITSGLYLDLNKKAKEIAYEYPEFFEYRGIDVIKIVNDSVTRYFYGDVPDFITDELQEIRERYITSSLIGLEVSNILQETWGPEVIFGNMEVYADWAPYFHYFRKADVTTSTISITQYNYHAVLLNQIDLYRSEDRYTKWLEYRHHRYLDNSEIIEIKNFLSDRFAGNDAAFVQYGYFNNDVSNIEKLNLNSAKRNIFLFSNVFWDVGMSEFGTLYGGVLDWVISTVKIIQDSEDIHLYIKPHPAEFFDVKSGKGVVDELYAQFATLPENVTIIHPEMKILTYDLFPYIDLGLVYNGTVGLEMLLHDIPVISCGKSPYNSVNLVLEPKTTQEYSNLLHGQNPLFSPRKEDVLRFCYFYFISTLIPWELTGRAYGDDFPMPTIKSINDLSPNALRSLDHICDNILSSGNPALDSYKNKY